MEYLQDSDYEIAAANGISRKQASVRFYNYGWSRERTVTEPLRVVVSPVWLEWRDIAKANGVTSSTFYTRIKAGWTPEKAATTPHFTMKEVVALATKKRKEIAKITEEVKKFAEANGICLATLQWRVYQSHWPVERAATEPIGHYFKRGKKK